MLELLIHVAIYLAWWFGLGLASSIGLGTGLHTFVLYLGPFIAKVCLIANECGHIPHFLPSRWNFKEFEKCQPQGSEAAFLSILWAVEVESLLWGIGTAFGELPPYFIARGAREANKKVEEVSELERPGGRCRMCKRLLYKALREHACITVLLCASIPNPLFDLAGLMCGHFGVPFVIFIVSTLIGKAVIKVHLQVVVTVLIFTGNHVEKLFEALEDVFPFLGSSLSEWLETEKKGLHNSRLGEASWIGVIWNLIVLSFIALFIISFLNAIVKRERDREENELLR